MDARPIEYQKALDLRRLGYSVGRIADLVGVSKSTASLWCKEIVLTAQQTKALKSRPMEGRAVGAHVVRSIKMKQAALEAGRKRAQTDEAFRLICALYWAEGSKRSEGFAICNSDRDLLLVVARWLGKERFTGKFYLDIRYYAQNGISEKDIHKHWKQVEDTVPGIAFKLRKAQISKASKGKVKRKLLHGTGYIIVNSIQLLYLVLGGIEFLKGDNHVTNSSP